MVKRLFKEYINKLDEKTTECGTVGLGIGLDSINMYYVGDMPRKVTCDLSSLPDLLPYGYLVGNHTSIILKLKDSNENSIDSLCYDTLVPKNVMQRYVSLLIDNKNLLFCGPSGTYKSYIARKIGEYLVKRQKDKKLISSIAYFNVENKTSKDLKQYLNNIIEQASISKTSEAPYVLIIDNLHNIPNISEAFLEYFSSNNSNNKKW